MSLEAKRTLIFAVLKFLKTEINAETTTADVKESLEGNIKSTEIEMEIIYSAFISFV